MIKFNKSKIVTLIRREKRFTAFMQDKDQEIQVYCPNSGRMTDICNTGATCLISQYKPDKYQWEATLVNNVWVGTNTQNPPKIIKPLLKDLFPGEKFTPEQFVAPTYKADFVSENIIVEVKNVHWRIDNKAYFPDCVTARGAKQVNVMSTITDKQCYLIYVLQRPDVKIVKVADFIDKEYAHAIKNAHNLKILAFNCQINPEGIQTLGEITYENS